MTGSANLFGGGGGNRTGVRPGQRLAKSAESLGPTWKPVGTDPRIGRHLLPDCIPWTGPKDRDGYGRKGIGKRKIQAHRWVWEQSHGTIPPGLQVLHRCDRVDCINLAHLFLGTHQTNMADRDRKRRQARGAKNGRALMSQQKACAILKQWPNLGQAELARKFGVSPHAVRGLVTGRTWKHLLRPRTHATPPEGENP